MDSKEEILKPFIEHSSNMFDEPKDMVEDCNCYIAMDEWAKQVAIDFYMYAVTRAFKLEAKETLTPEEIFELYIQSKK